MGNHEIELEVTRLMQELQVITKDMSNATLPFSIIIEKNIAKQKEIEAPYNERYALISNKIRELTLLKGKSIKTGSGSVTYRKGATRRTWDLDKLDTICEIDPYIRISIWDYRKENISEPSIIIKVDTAVISVSNI